MQSENLTDEQLWRAIAQNTNAMTALIHQQLELAAVTTISDSIRQAKLRESNAERMGKLERDKPGRRSTAKLLTKDEARRIAVNIAKLPRAIEPPSDVGSAMTRPMRPLPLPHRFHYWSRRNYREYTAELRRRYSLESEESAALTNSGSDAATVTAA